MIEGSLLTNGFPVRSHIVELGESLLHPADRIRFQRLRSEKRRETFAASRWLVHQALSSCSHGLQGSWLLSVDDRQRPIALDEPTGTRIRYSLTHREGMIACAISTETSVGVDLEPWDQPIASSMFDMVFTAKERDLLADRRGTSRRDWIARWTMKEAIAKMKGTVGLETIRQICTASIECWPAEYPAYLEREECWLFSRSDPLRFCVTLAVESQPQHTPKLNWVDANSWIR